jgi:signal transduction histidine kinase
VSRVSGASLEVVTSAGNRKLIPLEEKPLMLGRSVDCDVVIEETFVSGHHARIEPAGEGFIVKDLESTNGTWVDGTPVKTPKPLSHGSMVVLGRPGNYRIRFLSQSQEAVTHPEIVTPVPARGKPDESLQEVLEISKVLLSTLDLEEVLGRVLEACLRISQAERGYLFLREGSNLKLRASRGEAQEQVSEEQLEFSRSVALRVAKTGQAEFRTSQLGQGARDQSASIVRLRLETIGCVPLKIQQKVIGIVYVDSHQRSALPDATGREVLEVLAGLAAVAIENARLVSERVQNERWTTIGRMAASIVHDIRSPLAALRGTAELLRMKVPEAAHKEKLNVIIDEVDRLARLSGEMLEFSSEAQPLNVQATSLSRLVRDFLNSVAPRLEKEKIRLDARLEESDELPLDRHKMVRLLHNVVGNAVEAMEGGGTLKVETGSIDGHSRLAISDTGPGMPAEIVARIFEPFYTVGKERGSGLGMAIVRRIVEQHGATIDIDSAPGAGTRVEMHFFPSDTTDPSH